MKTQNAENVYVAGRGYSTECIRVLIGLLRQLCLYLALFLRYSKNFFSKIDDFNLHCLYLAPTSGGDHTEMSPSL